MKIEKPLPMKSIESFNTFTNLNVKITIKLLFG